MQVLVASLISGFGGPSCSMSFSELFGSSMPTEVAISVTVEVVLAALFALALLLVASHEEFYHHCIMLPAFLSDELVAKTTMVSRFTDGVLGDPFLSPTNRAFWKIALSVVATVSDVLTIALGFKFRTRKPRQMFLPVRAKRLHLVSGVIVYASCCSAFSIGMRVFSM